jgi:hypothetical protein
VSLKFEKMPFKRKRRIYLQLLDFTDRCPQWEEKARKRAFFGSAI